MREVGHALSGLDIEPRRVLVKGESKSIGKGRFEKKEGRETIRFAALGGRSESQNPLYSRGRTAPVNPL